MPPHAPPTPAPVVNPGSPSSTPPAAPHAPDGFLDGELIRLEVDLETHGEQVARQSGRHDPDPAALGALDDEADAAAARFASLPYAPETRASDAMYHEKFEALLVRHALLLQRVDYAAAMVRDSERARSALGALLPEPETPWLVGLLGTCGMALSLGLALHDVVFGSIFVDPSQALVASLTAGALLGAVASVGMLSAARHVGAKTPWEVWGWFTLGIVFAGAVGLLRYWLGEPLLAWGYAGIELVSVLAVKLCAVSLHRDVVASEVQRRGASAADMQVAGARAHHDECVASLERCGASLEAHRRHAQRRDFRAELTEAVKAGARTAVRVGYLRGIARNVGYLDGREIP